MTQLFRVTIPVRNIDAAARFYSSLLGNAGERISPAWHYFTFGQAILACHNAAAEGPAMPGTPHSEPLCIAVDENLEQLLIRARNMGGVDTDVGVTRYPNGEVGFYLRDPFGNLLMLIDARTMQWGSGGNRAAKEEAPKFTLGAVSLEAPMLMFERDFLNAVKGGELLRVKELLALDPDLIKARDAAGVSALMLAAYKRHENVASYLLGLHPVLSIWEAAAFGDQSALLEILQVTPDKINAHAVDGYLPLGLAAFFGHTDCVRLLLDRGAKVNAVSNNPMHARPLHSAVTQAPAIRALPVIQLLLRAGAEPNVGKSGGYTPLHLVVNRDECGLAEVLLRNNADMDLRANDNRSAWDVARLRAHAPMLALLDSYRHKLAAS